MTEEAVAAAVLATTGGAAMPATIDVAARDAAADFAVAIAATAAAAASIVASEGEDASAVLTKKHAGALAEALADAQTRLFYANEALRAAGDALDALHAAEAQDATTFTLAKQEATRPALMVLLTTKEAVCVRIQKVIAAAVAASGRAGAESVESEESEEGGAEWSGQAGGGAVATAAAGSLSIVVEWTAPLRMSVERIDREVYRKLVDAAAPASIEAQIALDARLDALRRCTLAEAVRKVGGMESWVHDEVVWHRCVYMRDPCAFEHKTDVHFPLPLSSFIFPLQGRDTALRCLSRAEPRCKPAPHRGRLSARSARSGNARRPGAGAER